MLTGSNLGKGEWGSGAVKKEKTIGVSNVT
jgi:hypothetical protein